MSRFWPVLIYISAVLLVFGIGYGWIVYDDIKKGEASVDWPSAPGRVISAEMVMTGPSGGGGVSAPEITYSYRVNGGSYTGSKIVGGPLEDHPVGSIITVFYDPDNPDREVLVQGASSGQRITLRVLTGITAAGIFGLMVGGAVMIRYALKIRI